MLIAKIDLEAPVEEIEAQELRAMILVTDTLQFVKNTLVELFLISPHNIQVRGEADGQGSSVWADLGGRGGQVCTFRVRHEVFPEKVLLYGVWSYAARFGASWSEGL